MALLVVLAVLLILWWVIGAIGGSGGSSNAATSTSTTPASTHSSSAQHSPSATTTSHPSSSASHSSSKSASKSPSASTTASKSSSAAPKPCPPSAIAVTVSTDAASYPVGVQPRLNMSVRNSGTSPCTRDVGQAALELRVSTAAGTLVWSSDDCAPGGVHDVVTLKPNQVFRTALVWSRTTSKRGCPTGQPKAAPGNYSLHGRNLALTSAGAAFALL